MKSKNFIKLVALFPKMYLLGLQHFFSSSTNLAISILSVLGRMYKIHVFDVKLYPLQTLNFAAVAMITEIVVPFFNIHSSHCYGPKFLQHIYAAY